MATVRLGDREYPLRYRVGDVVEAERLLNNESLESALVSRGMWRLAVLLRAGIKHAEPKLTAEQVQNRMDAALANGVSYFDLWNAVAEGIYDSGVMRRPGEGSVDPTTPGVRAPGNSGD